MRIDIIDYVKDLWPDWEPNDGESNLWMSRLDQYTEEAIHKALDAYKCTKQGSFKSPKIYDVLRFCKENVTGEKLRKVPTYGYIIECYDSRNKSAIGRKYKFYYNVVDGNPPDRQVLEEHAEWDRKRIENSCGGRWLIKWERKMK